MHVNGRASLHPIVAVVPMWFGTDRDALEFALRVLGSPEPDQQRVAWIRNTLCLERILVSESLVAEAAALDGWRVGRKEPQFEFDGTGNLALPALA
jgi:hypothetical protein